jgi:hypothetical protein
MRSYESSPPPAPLDSVSPRCGARGDYIRAEASVTQARHLTARRGDASSGRRRGVATTREGKDGVGAPGLRRWGGVAPGKRGGPRVETSRVVGFQMDGKMRPG